MAGGTTAGSIGTATSDAFERPLRLESRRCGDFGRQTSFSLRPGNTQTGTSASSSSGAGVASSVAAASGAPPALGGSGKKDYVPLWLSSTKLGNSKLFQSTAGNVGIGTTVPLAALDVAGHNLQTFIGNPGMRGTSLRRNCLRLIRIPELRKLLHGGRQREHLHRCPHRQHLFPYRK